MTAEQIKGIKSRALPGSSLTRCQDTLDLCDEVERLQKALEQSAEYAHEAASLYDSALEHGCTCYGGYSCKHCTLWEKADRLLSRIEAFSFYSTAPVPAPDASETTNR
jgi:hypothetical protein